MLFLLIMLMAPDPVCHSCPRGTEIPEPECFSVPWIPCGVKWIRALFPYYLLLYGLLLREHYLLHKGQTLQWFEMLRPLTTMDMDMVGEMATIPVWEKLATKEGRKHNLGMAIYYLLLWTPLLSMAICVPINPSLIAEDKRLPSTNSTAATTEATTTITTGSKQMLSPCTSFALVCLFSCGFSLPLFLYQVKHSQCFFCNLFLFS